MDRDEIRLMEVEWVMQVKEAADPRKTGSGDFQGLVLETSQCNSAKDAFSTERKSIKIGFTVDTGLGGISHV